MTASKLVFRRNSLGKAFDLLHRCRLSLGISIHSLMILRRADRSLAAAFIAHYLRIRLDGYKRLRFLDFFRHGSYYDPETLGDPLPYESGCRVSQQPG